MGIMIYPLAEMRDYVHLKFGDRYAFPGCKTIRTRQHDHDPIPEDFLAYLGWPKGENISVDSLLSRMHDEGATRCESTPEPEAETT